MLAQRFPPRPPARAAAACKPLGRRIARPCARPPRRAPAPSAPSRRWRGCAAEVPSCCWERRRSPRSSGRPTLRRSMSNAATTRCRHRDTARSRGCISPDVSPSSARTRRSPAPANWRSSPPRNGNPNLRHGHVIPFPGRGVAGCPRRARQHLAVALAPRDRAGRPSAAAQTRPRKCPPAPPPAPARSAPREHALPQQRAWAS